MSKKRIGKLLAISDKGSVDVHTTNELKEKRRSLLSKIDKLLSDFEDNENTRLKIGRLERILNDMISI